MCRVFARQHCQDLTRSPCQASNLYYACRDDVVFHDDFLSIFPDYWASVPANYEYIAVGMIPRHFNVSEKTVYGEPPRARSCPLQLLTLCQLSTGSAVMHICVVSYAQESYEQAFNSWHVLHIQRPLIDTLYSWWLVPMVFLTLCRSISL